MYNVITASLSLSCHKPRGPRPHHPSLPQGSFHRDPSRDIQAASECTMGKAFDRGLGGLRGLVATVPEAGAYLRGRFFRGSQTRARRAGARGKKCKG